MENTQEYLHQKWYKRRPKKQISRWIRFAIVTTVMIASVSTLYYTRFRPSSALVDKLVLVNETIARSVGNLKRTSDDLLEEIKSSVRRHGNTKEDVKVLKRAEHLKERTANLVGDIEKYKKMLITRAGGGFDNNTQTVKRPKDQFYTYREMIGWPGSKPGLAYQLEKQLDAYSHWLNTEYNDLLKDQLVLLTKVGGVQDPKDFVRHNFRHKPIVLALAKLTQIQHRVLEDESKVLNKLKAVVPRNEEIKFDKIHIGVSAQQSVLRSGDTYRANIGLTAYPSKLKTKMTVNGTPIKVDKGIGKVKFKTTYPLGQKTWKGTITFKNRGRDTTFKIEKIYMVVPRMK